MKSLLWIILGIIAARALAGSAAEPVAPLEKTAFQTRGEWKPTTDVRSDVAIVYGADDGPEITFAQRAQSWRDHGYQVGFMTGIAWGGYQEYFLGKWDGTNHLDEAQMEQNGEIIWHGKDTPYIVPTTNYLAYFKERIIKKVIDTGVDSIYLEEPEFWVRGGYSPAFKKEWKAYYGVDWKPQHESAENMYLANKLKYHLYFRALDTVFTYAKEYGLSKGMKVRCYVPTHSLLNYSQWQIVSPEASLAALPSVDGYIVQAWTGTSREPNYFEGIAKERVFETAFLEYGCMRSMTRPTGRKLFFENDPVEDTRRDWADYKRNCEMTFTAELLYPDIDNFEVMPWPDRIFDGKYFASQNSSERTSMPRSYSTQLLVMINALNDLKTTENKTSGTQGISILIGNSLMFQQLPTHDDGRAWADPYFSNFYETSGMFHRYPTEPRLSDPLLSNFYGEALPFLKRGVPIGIVHLENLGFPKALRETKILLLSYSNLKPLSAQPHERLAEWIHQGGILVYSGRDNDPFQTVTEWWNTGDRRFKCPADDLFERLGLGQNPKAGTYRFGKGRVCVIRMDPKEYVLESGRDSVLRANVEPLYRLATGKRIEYKNNFSLERGPYEIDSVMLDSVSDRPCTLKGKLIDLYDPALPILDHKTIRPGEQAFLYNLERVANPLTPQVVASAARIYEEQAVDRRYSFVARGPLKTTAVIRVLLPSEPKVISVTDAAGQVLPDVKSSWDTLGKTVLLGFENHPEGVKVWLEW